MHDFSLLVNASTIKFRLQAFTEYCEARRRNYQAIMALVGDVIANIPGEDLLSDVEGGATISTTNFGDANSVSTSTNFNSMLATAGSQTYYGVSTGYKTEATGGVTPIKGYYGTATGYDNVVPAYHVDNIKRIKAAGFEPKSMICLPQGYITLIDLLDQCYTAVDKSLNSDIDDSADIILKDATGAVRNKLTYEQLATDLNQSIHSVTALIAANKAAAAEKVSDRIQIFRDELNTLFTNPFSDVSNTSGVLKDLLEKTEGSVDLYMSAVGEYMNINKLASDQSTDLPSEDRFSKYSGATPTACLSTGLKGVGQAVSSVINAGAKVLGAAISGLFSLGKCLFKRIGRFVSEHIINPNDLKYDTNGEYPYIDGFAIESAGYVPSQLVTTIPTPTGISDSDFVQYLSTYINKWVSYDCWFGAIQIQIESVKVAATAGYVEVVPKFIIKPKIIDSVYPQALINCGGLTAVSDEPTDKGWSAYKVTNPSLVLSALATIDASPVNYLTDSSNEDEVFKGLADGLFCFGVLLQAALGLSGPDNPIVTGGRISYLTDVAAFKTALGGQIRNCDFITLASGYYWQTDPSNWEFASNLKFSGASVVQVGRHHSIAQGIPWAFMTLFALHVVEKTLYPIEYTFFPYCEDSWTMPSAKWSVVSDADNQKAFSTFAATAFLVAVVAIVGVAGTVAIKKIVTARAQRALEIQSKLNNKLWTSKEPLTKKEWKRYRKATKRLNKTGYLSRGMQESAPTSEENGLNANNADQLLTDMKGLIKAY